MLLSRLTWAGRTGGSEVSATAPLRGARARSTRSAVALLIDVEEAFAKGHKIVLSDERALSQRRSPFRDIPSLGRVHRTLLVEQAA